MSCPAFERLAAAASGDDVDEDVDLLAHLDGCADCQRLVEEQAATRALLAQAPAPRLSSSHREQLGAEVMARADHLPAPRARLRPASASLLAAAAIALAVGAGALLAGRGERAEVVAIEAPAHEVVAPTVATVTPVTPVTPERATAAPERVTAPPQPPGDRRAALDGTGAFTREVRADREIVTLASGELTVDADRPGHPTARPVHVVTGDTTLALRHARVKVIATKGVIAQVSVFAGTAQITVNGTTQVIEAGMVWERPATPADSSTEFQAGWAALREGRNAEAIAAFDRAVDPVVAEDALYWGAIASERAGDPAGAIQRYELLVEKFPSSPRAKKARDALARLGH